MPLYWYILPVCAGKPTNRDGSHNFGKLLVQDFHKVFDEYSVSISHGRGPRAQAL